MKSIFYLLLMLPLSTLVSQEKYIQSSLEIYTVSTNKRQVVLTEDSHFEAPNWSRDGKSLLVNSHGKLYRFDIHSNEKVEIPTGFADKLNNDHGISPDGNWIVVSHHGLPSESAKEEWPGNWLESRIYILPYEGGVPRLVTPNAASFWHGWSPDGQRLAYVGLREGNFDIYSIDIGGGEELRLTFHQGLDDGPDYSPDGKSIYYNSMQSGKMEIWRMNTDGSNKEQLTNDDYSNWFPHPSPNGDHVVFLSYLEDQGDAHPPMKPVALRLYHVDTGHIKTICTLTGGQGTINVPSWSPDGNQFAFVSYEYLETGD